MRGRLAACVFVVGLSLPAAAQTGTIAGTVTDAESGHALRSANVQVVGLNLGAAADASGRYVIDGVPTGEYHVRASYVGMDPVEKMVTVPSDVSVTVDFALRFSVAQDPVDVVADRLRTVGRTGAPAHLIPQSVASIEARDLEAQGITTIENALRNVSGVQVSGREQPFATFTLRGFPADGTGTFRRNGVEVTHAYGGLGPNVTEVEVLKGPASVLYGRLEPGGVVNFVTRRPDCGAPAVQIEALAGSFAEFYGHSLIQQCLADSATFAIDASARKNDGHRIGLSEESAFISTVSQLKTQEGTLTFTVEGEYEAASAGLDPGLALLSPDLPGSFDDRPFFGEPEAGYRWGSAFGAISASRQLVGPGMSSVVARISYGSYRHGRDLITLDSLIQKERVARSITSDDTHYRYLHGEVSLDGSAWSGTLRHQYVVGMEATRLAIDVDGNAPLVYDNGELLFATIDPVDLRDPQATGLPGEGDIVDYVTARGSGVNLGVFGQNRVSVETAFGMLHSVLSARLAHVAASAEWFALADTPDTPAGLNNRGVAITALTPSSGVVLEVADELALYASYGTSFNPIFQQVDADGRPFDPTTGQQFELGAKIDGTHATATLSAYHLSKRGALTREPGGFYVQTGEQRSKGIDIDLRVHPHASLAILGAVSLMEAVVTRDETVPTGNRLPAAPIVSGRVWTHWTPPVGDPFAPSIALGGQFVGERYGSLDNSLRLPSYMLVDLSVGITAFQSANFRLGVENLLNEQYFITATRKPGVSESANNLIVGWPGLPRTVRLRLSVEL